MAGAGDDTISLSNFITGVTNNIDGGADRDRILINGRASSVVITTGAGVDAIEMGSINGSAQITVTDFAAGAGGDSILLASLLPQLSGWDGSSNPFGAGFLRLIQSGADTLFQWDQTGPATGGSSWQTMFLFRNTLVGDFTDANFPVAANSSQGYHPNGGGIFGQQYNGTDSGNVLIGSIGDDLMTGLGGDDILSGGNGNDVVDGGGDADTLTGGFGADILSGGASADAFIYEFASQGADAITDFTSGLDKIHVSASGFGGGLAVGGVTAAQFASGSTVAFTTAAQRFFFDSDVGDKALWFDADGSGTGQHAVLVATLDSTAALVSSDLLVI